MRIEMPRLHGIVDPAGLIRGVNNCHVEFAEFLGLTEDPLAQFRRSVSAMLGALNIMKRQHEQIADLVTKLLTHSQKVVEAGQAFVDRFQGVVDIGTDVLTTSERCSQSLDAFTHTLTAKQCSGRVRARIGGCDCLARRARERRHIQRRARGVARKAKAAGGPVHCV